jgi:exosortase/archaeosortase family protein
MGDDPTTGANQRMSLLGRVAVACLLVVLAIAILTIWSAPYRSMEAHAASCVVGIFTPTKLYGNEWLVTGHGGGLWFVVTNICTSGLIVLPLLGFAAWATLMRRVKVSMALAGLVAGTLVVLVLSTARLAMIGLSWWKWGYPSLWLAHDFVGTFISLIAMALGLGVQVAVTGRWGKMERRSFEGEAA